MSREGMRIMWHFYCMMIRLHHYFPNSLIGLQSQRMGLIDAYKKNRNKLDLQLFGLNKATKLRLIRDR